MSEEQGIDTLAKELAGTKEELVKMQEQLESKEDKTEEEEEQLHSVEEFIEHFNTCDDKNCETSHLKNNVLAKGVVMGIAIEKKKNGQKI
jgi:hypothetical protein